MFTSHVYNQVLLRIDNPADVWSKHTSGFSHTVRVSYMPITTQRPDTRCCVYLSLHNIRERALRLARTLDRFGPDRRPMPFRTGSHVSATSRLRRTPPSADPISGGRECEDRPDWGPLSPECAISAALTYRLLQRGLRRFRPRSVVQGGDKINGEM